MAIRTILGRSIRRGRLAFCLAILTSIWTLHVVLGADDQIGAWTATVLPHRHHLPYALNRAEWQPPFDWTGERVVYDNFPLIGGRYASGTKSLQRFPWLWNIRPSSYSDGDDLQERRSFSRIPCRGPDGHLLNESDAQTVLRHAGHTTNFADPTFGSSALVGFEQDVCYDRYGRHGLYGLDGGREDGRPTVEWKTPPVAQLGWSTVNWARLQRDCYNKNKHRFTVLQQDPLEPPPCAAHQSFDQSSSQVSRTAVVIRSHQDQKYNPELKRTIRSVIQELALHTGAEHAVFLLVQIKDSARKILTDETAHRQALVDFVPAEFHSITVLWNNERWQKEYPLIPKDFLNVHLSQWLPMQHFQKLYPEFDYYWNWEMDVRYTGHYYDLVRAIHSFTSSQPRKGLWERNARLYIPRAHGSYTDFRNRIQMRYQTGSDTNDTSIWGPLPPGNRFSAQQKSWLTRLNNTFPAPSSMNDDFEWGVGEPADFVTFLPMFNPGPTPYVFHDAYRNYDRDLTDEQIHRRTSIITFTRLSSRLLTLMDLENKELPMHHMSSETWPHSVALHFGLKAVSVPHPIYMEHEWPNSALDFVFNNGDQKWTLTHHRDHSKLDPRGEGSGGPESTFGWGREHNWERSTWYYRNRFAAKLYKRWLGWNYEGIGGHRWEKEHGTYCLPPMLLHPIKDLEDSVTED